MLNRLMLILMGGESAVLNQLNTFPDAETNITSFGHTTTFYAGVEAGPILFLYKGASFDLSGGKELSLEATFYNRENLAPHNEAYIVFGDNATAASELYSTGFGIGYAGTFILNRFYLPPTSPDRVVRFGAAPYAEWHTLKATIQVVGGNLMLVSLTDNGSVVAGSENIVIGPTSAFPWLGATWVGVGVDDTIDGIRLSGSAVVSALSRNPAPVPSTSPFGLLALGMLIFGLFILSKKQFKKI